MFAKIELAHALITLIANSGDLNSITNRIREIVSMAKNSNLTEELISQRLSLLYEELKDEFEPMINEFNDKTFNSKSLADKRLARTIYSQMVLTAKKHIEQAFPELSQH